MDYWNESVKKRSDLIDETVKSLPLSRTPRRKKANIVRAVPMETSVRRLLSETSHHVAQLRPPPKQVGA